MTNTTRSSLTLVVGSGDRPWVASAFSKELLAQLAAAQRSAAQHRLIALPSLTALSRDKFAICSSWSANMVPKPCLLL